MNNRPVAIRLADLIVLSGVAVIAGLGVSWIGQAEVIWLEFILLIMVLLIPFAVVMVRHRLEFFELAHFFVLSLGIFYVAPLVYSLLFDGSSIESNAFSEAIGYLIMGSLCFYVAYYSRFGRAIAMAFPRFEQYRFIRVRFRMVLLGFLLIALVSFLIVVARSGGPLFYVTHLGERVIFWEKLGYLWWGVLLVIPSLWSYYAYLLDTRGKAHFGFWILVCFSVVFLVSLGSRWNIISLSLGLLIIRHYAVRRVKLGQLIGLGVILLVFSFFFQFYRNYISIEYYMQIREQGDLLSRFVFGSLSGFDSLVLIIEGIPQVLDFQWGRSILDLIWYPIPRLLWADKPEITAMLFCKAFFPEATERGVIRGIPYMGELYLNFGPAGIVIGMLALGLFCRVFYAYMKLNRFGLISILIYVCTIEPLMRSMRGGVFALVSHFFMNLIPVAIILIVSTREWRYVNQPRT